MTPALTSFDATMGCEKRSSWELKSAANTSFTALLIQEYSDSTASGSFLWDGVCDEEAETSSFTSSSVDDLGASITSNIIAPTNSTAEDDHETDDHHPDHSPPARHHGDTDSTNDSTPPPIKEKKVVHFNPIAMCKYVDKISDDDSKKVWYSPLEMILLKKESIFTLWCLSAEDMSLSDPSASCSERYSIRGLEAQRDQIQGRQAVAKHEALRVVLQEQDYRRQIAKKTGAAPSSPPLVLKEDIIPPCTKNENDHHALNHDDDIHNAASYYYRDNDLVAEPPLDDEALAEKYAKASDPSKQAALLQAFEDEQVVKMMPYQHPTSKHHRYLFRFL